MAVGFAFIIVKIKSSMQSLVHEKYEIIINESNREGDESLPARSFFCIEIQCGGTSPNFYWLVMCVGFKNHLFALFLFLSSFNMLAYS